MAVSAPTPSIRARAHHAPHAQHYHDEMTLSQADHALIALGQLLLTQGYQFTCITPESHALVRARSDITLARNVRDVFGWSRPFTATTLPTALMTLLREANVLVRVGEHFTSLVRYASFDHSLVVHSAWPTLQHDAVFFGPDTYRFAGLIEREFAMCRAEHDRLAAAGTLVDLGCGSGAGGIAALRYLTTQVGMPVVFTDINPQALRYARVNAVLAGVQQFSCIASDVLTQVPDPIAMIVANPPYLVDPQQRTYRHGGGLRGTDLSQRIVREALTRLVPGGRVILYTATPIVDGKDLLWQAIAPWLQDAAVRYRYHEIDPDVFGSELAQPAYADVERIAAVGLSVQVPPFSTV